MSRPRPTWCDDATVTSAVPRIVAKTATSATTIGIAKPRPLWNIVDVRLLVEHDRLVVARDRKAYCDQPARELGDIAAISEFARRDALSEQLGAAHRQRGRLRRLDRIARPAAQLAADAGVGHRPGDDEETASRRLQRKLAWRIEADPMVASSGGGEVRNRGDVRIRSAHVVRVGSRNS